MIRQTILFDLDDTLIHCNKYFDFVLEQLVDTLQTWFKAHAITAIDVKKKQLEIDTLGVNRHGFTTDHFPQSLVDTYEYFSLMTGRSESAQEKEWLLQLGKSVYDREVEPYPDMVVTLEHLQAEGHELHLYTGGVASVQEKKIKALSLETFFGDRVFIRQHKTAAALEDILTKEKFDRAATWMVGNSLRTDIVPALETGIHAIYVPAITEWEYNIIDITVQPKGAFYTIASLKEVPTAIANYSVALH
jgi:putative hydrolase of the HAD superfamily